jgi:hypothetical protein
MELQTKFIEGTNEQYSIREDGAVIKHYELKYFTYLGKHIVTFENVIKTPEKDYYYMRVNGKQKYYSSAQLIHIHFGYAICRHCKCKTSNYYVCKKCKREVRNAAAKKRKLENPEKFKEQISKKNLKIRTAVTKSYVSTKLNIPVKDIPEELYVQYKNLILYKREIVKKHNVHMSSLSNTNSII